PGLLARVPVVIKISNWPPQYVRPQAGINSADLIFEHYNEGWFATRWTGVYLGRDPARVGPVRSGRLIDLEIPAIYKGVLACWGFSDGVLALFRDSDLYPDRVVSYSLPETLDPDPFYRDESRDVPLEHTGYTDPARVRAWAEAHGVSGRQDLSGMVFSEEPPAEGEPATYIHIPWRDLNAEWRYDEATGRYLRWSDGTPHIDALDGRQLGAANVVVLYVPQWDTDIVEDPYSGALSIQFALWHSNRAIIFRDGVRIDGFWQRWERWDMLTLTDREGNPIPLKVGNTFFEVIPPEGLEVVVEPMKGARPRLRQVTATVVPPFAPARPARGGGNGTGEGLCSYASVVYSSSRTSTISPAGRWSASSGTTARPSACTSELRMPEPWSPVSVASSPSSVFRSRTRR
ncbi:MAG TPA: DUF3048 domain-containing protein, partial [Anaerolineales bacterium]|nr:DUF3048 domain-containing protein [Anaerolineales bacterium]